MRHGGELLPLFPLLFIPLWTDCYHSVLVKQETENGGEIMPMRAIWETLLMMPSFIPTKLKFFFAAYLWSLLPIIGWYKDFVYRIRWAMTSNVVVFEKVEGDQAKEKCEQLSDIVFRRKGTNALFAIPSILSFCVIVFFALTTAAYASPVFFWVSVIAACWILLPGSAVVNTFVYLSVTDNSALRQKRQ
jgi:hypothetical protein